MDRVKTKVQGSSLDTSDILSFTAESKFLVPIHKQMKQKKLPFYLIVEIPNKSEGRFSMPENTKLARRICVIYG